MASSLSAFSNLVSNRDQAIDSLITKQINTIDDASSMASMSSKPDPTTCHICHEKESMISRLILCVKCGNGFHGGCPTPRIDDHNKEYKCQRCIEKAAKKATAERDRDKRAGCDVCGNPIYHGRPTSTRLLCFQHWMADRKEAAPRPTSRPTPPSRPINKSKLHRLRPDDRPLVKKRKRTESRKAADSILGGMDNAGMVSKPSIARKTSIPSLHRQIQQISQGNTNKTQSVTPGDPLPSHIEAFNGLLKSGIAQPPSDRVAPKMNAPRSDCLVQSTGGVIRPHDYEPSKTDNAAISPTDIMNDRDDSPSSQITQEMKATVEDYDEPEISSATSSRLLSLVNEQQPTYAEVQYPPMPRDLDPLVYKDGKMPNIDDSGINRRRSQHQHTQSQTPSPPNLQSAKLPTFSDVNDVEENVYKVSYAEHSASGVGTILSRRVKQFDGSVLDSFLYQDQEPQDDPLYERTPRELLETQIWGNIDPRVVWPRPLDPTQKEARDVEIGKRGSRKANFGKHLTPQLKQERAKKGWHMHQTCERKDDEESREMIQHLEELFGGHDMGNYVPTTVGGRLVMHERERPVEPRKPGRQKKEVQLAVLPVMGGH